MSSRHKHSRIVLRVGTGRGTAAACLAGEMIFSTLLLMSTGNAHAETVTVKYRGPVDLKPFECATIYQSSVVKRLCYDAKEEYVVVSLNGTYSHYCEVPAFVVSGWRASNSMGDYFNKNVRGHFDCRVNRVPAYR